MSADRVDGVGRDSVLSRSGLLANMSVVAICAVLVLMIGACGSGEDRTVVPQEDCTADLRFIREDSSAVEIGPEAETYVWCGDWNPGEIAVPTLHVWVGTVEPPQNGWWLRAVVADIEREAPMQFPNYFVWNQPDSVHVFLIDPPNELATDQPEADGSILFHEVPCPDGERVDFTLDARLGSEYGDLPAVSVCGRFEGAVTGPPPWWPAVSR